MASPANIPRSQRDSLHTAGSVFFVSETGKILKLPIPSDSPLDPLTWSLLKRVLAFLALELYATIAHFELTLPGLLIKPLQYEFGRGPSGPVCTETITAVMNLVPALGYFLSVPLSTAVGRRPVFIASAIITCVSTLWAGVCTSFDQLVAAVAFQSMAAGASMTLATLILIDATFIHERPNVLSLHWSFSGFFQRLALVLMPLVLDLDKKWRPIYLFSFAVAAVALGAILFLLPETYFLRPPVALDGRVLIQTGSEKVYVYTEDEYGGSTDKKASDEGQKDPSRQQFGVAAFAINWKAIPATYMQMLPCLFNPLSFWVALLGAANLSGVIFLLSTQPMTVEVLFGNGQETVSMLLGVAGMIGSILAFPLTGPLMSWFARRTALQEGGIRHAEVYLFSFSIPVVTSLLSILLDGLAAHYSWGAGVLYVASGLSNISYITANVAFALWITEAFPPWAAAALAVQSIVVNVVSFGIGHAVMAWLDHNMVMAPTIFLCCLTAVLGGFIVPAVFWGKEVRQYLHGRWGSSERGALRPQ